MNGSHFVLDKKLKFMRLCEVFESLMEKYRWTFDNKTNLVHQFLVLFFLKNESYFVPLLWRPHIPPEKIQFNFKKFLSSLFWDPRPKRPQTDAMESVRTYFSIFYFVNRSTRTTRNPLSETWTELNLTARIYCKTESVMVPWWIDSSPKNSHNVLRKYSFKGLPFKYFLITKVNQVI